MSALRCIDLFAGAGGFSEGAKSAGLNVVWAANHWPAACEVHESNHPGTIHACQDLQQADWTVVPDFDILLASPACQGHTKVRGKERPGHDAKRATAWAVVSAAECHRPQAVVVENVPEIADWVLWPAWCQAMEALGYTLSAEILDASRFRVPQFRERLFVVAMLKKRFAFPPLPSHDLVPISSVLDMDGGTWRPWEASKRIKAGMTPLVPATMARINAAILRHGDRPFRIQYNGSSRGGITLDRPIGTITTVDRFALVKGDQFRFVNTAEAQAAMGFRPDYKLTGNHKDDILMLGNAVPPPVPEWLLPHVMEAVA